MTKNSYWNYHIRQYNEQYRSTVSLIDFLKKQIPKGNFSALDIGCGGGADIHWLKKSFQEGKFMGIDIDNEAINLAREMNKDIRFEELNFLDIEKSFSPESFDYVFAVQFISFVDFDFPIFLEKAFYLAKKGIFISALFSEGWIEQHTIANDLEENWKGLYKIYSLERFKKTAKKMANKNIEIEYERFKIDISLPKPSKPKFGTYTINTETDEKLQVSGYMLMPWYNLFIKFK
ncbi:MAG: putative methyltransferase [Candidatus Methanoperedens nitroreducens]|uniref:Putative methyltransferase n=1 Tax=Candidatus Methanoperedens nitratireducens TaxID=1392998 RepID=A0A0P8ACV7_9EURY|nr:class I SAM-dependent methyltransferase [Candidatus Methanoperedens sp. BLZ2]KAB2946573.1 MAG: class I SAM-dependent methyltransferase [Candidatus Methanoperedens sp.]KPQ41955.1 MAG: putative methyltransferase [Candidatus Methanoperedens sp. BLZ1]MBZ0175075.1 class I SAM-dependent methyltransferase [Candidatus Methanoperedens nitroreducens]